MLKRRTFPEQVLSGKTARLALGHEQQRSSKLAFVCVVRPTDIERWWFCMGLALVG